MEAVDFVSKIDYSISHTPDTVRYVSCLIMSARTNICCSVFETSIRYLAASLSAYELSGKKHPILVEKAKQLADQLAFGWATPVNSLFNT